MIDSLVNIKASIAALNLTIATFALFPPSPTQAEMGFVGDSTYAIERVSQGRFIYPRAAQRREIEGDVLLEITIGVDGDVVDAFVVEASPPNRFEKNALKWVRSWIYEPLVINGQSVQVEKVRVPVKYRLRKLASL